MIGKKVFVTGANGMLGSNIVKYFKTDVVGLSSSELDITNLDAVRACLEDEKPDIIVHTAAFTNVDACELDPNKAYEINTLGTQNLVNYCVDKEILFIYLSSTGVYGSGKKEEGYSELDEVHPTTVHHKSKYEGEKIVQKLLDNYLIIRTGWLYGGNKEHKKNFVYKRLLEAQNNKIIYSDKTQIGNPTYVMDLIEQLKVLIENSVNGIYNCVNKAENISRYDYVKKIIELSKIDCKVVMGQEETFKRVAPVSKNESARNYQLDLLELNIMGDWEDSLMKYIEILRKDI